MITLEYLQKHYGELSKVEPCTSCDDQGSFEVTVSRKGNTFQINLADFNLAAALLKDAKDKGLTKSLEKDGDSFSLMLRCICFQVTDPNGTRTECFLCHEPPDVRCYGPYQYCPSSKATFSMIEDDSINYVHMEIVHLPNETCVGGWVAMLNEHPSRSIRVYYTIRTGTMNVATRPRGPQPNPNEIYSLIGCVGGEYQIVRSEYIN